MLRMRFLLAGILVLFTSILNAQLSITGNAPAYPNRSFSVILHEDELLRTPLLAGTFETNETGGFSINIPLGETRVIVLRFGFANLKFFVSPGGQYDIRIPTENEGLLRSASTETYSTVIFNNLDTSDPNAQIGAFSEMYNRFFAEHSFEIAKSSYPGSKTFIKASADKLKNTQLITGEDSTQHEKSKNFLNLALDFTRSVDSISKNWDEYSRLFALSICGELELSANRNPNEIFRDYILNKPFDLHNAGYVTLLEVFYNNAFQSMRFVGSAKQIAKMVNEAEPCDSIVSFLSRYEVFSATGPREIGILQMLRNMRKEGMIEKDVYIYQLERCRNHCFPNSIGYMPQTLIERDKIGKSGWEMPELVLLNSSEEIVKIEPKVGTYTYLFFFSSWSKQSIEEMQILEKLAEQYRKDLQVICISLDENFAEYKNFCLGSNRYKLNMLYGFSDPLIREKTGVLSFPTAMLFNPDGILLKDQSPLPSKNLEKDINSLTQKPEEKLKVWDD